MNKILTVLCLLLIGLFINGCTQGADESVIEDPPVAAEDNDVADTNPQDEITDEAETEDTQIPESENGLMDFDPTAFYFGKTYGEIEKEFTDLEPRGYLDGGEWYYSTNADMYFIFDGSQIADPQNPGKDIELSAHAAPAIKVFPNMGERIEKTAIEEYVGTTLERSMDDNIGFEYQGYLFWYYQEDTMDILPDTIITFKEYSE